MNYRKILMFFGIVGVVFAVYFGTATKWTFRPPWTVDYVNPMAQAIRVGRLDIPNPAMTYDLSMYNGRWYMTWGLLAAIVHIPLQLLADGRYVPALYTTILFGSVTVGVVWKMLERARLDWFPKAPAWQTIGFTLLYAFGTMQYYLSTVGSIWQVNQVVSTFFGVLGTAVILKKKRSIGDYLLSSAFYSVALWGRPTVGLLMIIPLFLLFYEVSSAKKLIYVITPIVLSLSALLIYNAARFANPLETGHRFLTEAPDLAARRQQYGMLSFSYLPTNAWHMVVAPPKFSWANGLRIDIDLMGNSIFWLSPVLLFAMGTVRWVFNDGYSHLVKAAWLGIGITAFASLLYYNTGWMQFGYRYALDFSFLLFLLAYIWLQGRFRWWVVLLSVYTLWVNYTGIRLLQ